VGHVRVVAGVAGMKNSVHESNVASATFVRRWLEERTFVWLVTEEAPDEYRRPFAPHCCHRSQGKRRSAHGSKLTYHVL